MEEQSCLVADGNNDKADEADDPAALQEQKTRAKQVTSCEEVLRNVLLTGKKRKRTNAAHGADATRPAKTPSKEQFTRWVLEAEAGLSQVPLVALLVQVVFLLGAARGGNRPPFLRAFLDVDARKVVVYIHKLSTFNGLARKILAAGIEVASLRAGEARAIGPLQAQTGLTSARHSVSGTVMTAEIRAAVAATTPQADLARLPRCVRYEYAHGIYWECGNPCARAGHRRGCVSLAPDPSDPRAH